MYFLIEEGLLLLTRLRYGFKVEDFDMDVVWFRARFELNWGMKNRSVEKGTFL